MSEREIVIASLREEGCNVGVGPAVRGVVMAKKSAMAAVSKLMGRSSQRCQSRALRAD
jgi:hypothetical protein